MVEQAKYLTWITVLTGILIVFPAANAAAQNFADMASDTQGAENALGADAADPDLQQALQTIDGSPLPDGVDSTYTMGADDVIGVEVMRHPEVSGQYLINREGKIQYEFVGDILVSGKTKDEVVELIKEQLSKYIVNPQVSVKILQYNSKVVYVVGEVFRPGKIFMKGDTMTIREALVQAGLPQLTGITKKSKLITPADKGQAKTKHVNVYALLYEGDLRENYIMEPGDVLYIPPTFLTRTMRALQPITAPISDAAGTAGKAYGY